MQPLAACYRLPLLAQAIEKRLDNGRVELKADPTEVAEGIATKRH